MDKKNTYSIAVFGCSHWHMPLYYDCIKKYNICGITDPDPGICRNISNELDCGFYSSPQELLSNYRPDFAFCFAPHSEMPHLAELMIRHRIPFSIEKPVGINSGQISRLIRLNEKYKTYCSIPFIWRISSIYKILKSELHPEHILHMSFTFIAGSPDRYRNTSPWMLQKKYAGGGCMTNLGVHFIDLALALTDSVHADVTGCSYHYAYDDIDIETHAVALLQIKNTSVVIETGYSYPSDGLQKRINHWKIVTTDGIYIVNNNMLEIRIWNKPPRLIKIGTDSDIYYPLYAEQCIFLAGNGREPVTDLYTMLNVHRILDKMNSTNRGKKI